MHAPRCRGDARVRRGHLPVADGARERHRRIRPTCLCWLLAAGDLRRAFAAALCALVPRRAPRSAFCTHACRGGGVDVCRVRHGRRHVTVGPVAWSTLDRDTRARLRLHGTLLVGTSAFASGALTRSAQVPA